MKAIKIRETALLEQAVLSGRFKEAERIAQNLVASDVRSAALKAQVLIYKGELEEARQLLESFEPRLTGASLKDAAEFGLAKGEWFYWRGEYEEAERQAHIVFGICSLQQDHPGLARALSLIGRICRRRGDFRAAEQHMLRAQPFAESVRKTYGDFLLGVIAYNLGAIAQNLGRFQEAESQYLTAIEILGRTEAGRYYGNALNGYGSLLNSKGQYEEAARVIQQAYECLLENACFDDLAHATNNLAYSHIRLGNFEHALRLLTEGVELRRRSNDIAGESATLELIGRVHYERADFDQAERALRQALELADLAKNEHEKAVALITLARVKMAQGHHGEGQALLNDALHLAIALKNRSLQAEAHTYLAEACVLSGNGLEALEHLRQATDLMTESADAYTRAQRDRIERLVQGERVKVEEGVFSIRSSFLPTWREAHESLGKFLLVEALKHAGGNQTRAAELLGVTKAYVTMLRKKYGV